jgi:hypothetical protein
MRLTIIPIDKKVGVNNFYYGNLDLSSCSIPANIHALQWYETEGEIEFVNNADRTKPQNELITQLPEWANACVDKWNEAKVAEETARALAEAAAKESVLTPIQ